ncbi:uncharacterized protein BXZ73DRAFT_97474 [Epithele typhae]|uniref:uncharacterized protein n=1 Tax=Epithele typhae TaxID=378194 RepID=UPI002007E67C|nr:uncharacterized protein BXZ73DRAFT_97474 [Epithele typhae]KAH9943432.1 hypothetical protein BXZ73DRAFT_97474 [Epithele typhae]
MSCSSLYMPHDGDHDIRQAFRKIIHNVVSTHKRDDGIRYLKTVQRLASDAAKDPTRQFRRNNDRISEEVVRPSGVLEVLLEMGFRSVVKNNDEYFSHAGGTLNKNLRIGITMLQETLECEGPKQSADEHRHEQEKAEKKAAVETLLKKIKDDRISVRARVQRERQSGQYEKGIPPRSGTVKPGKIATLQGSDANPCTS